MLKVWLIDPGVVVEELVLYNTGQSYSLLGPAESFRRLGTQPE